RRLAVLLERLGLGVDRLGLGETLGGDRGGAGLTLGADTGGEGDLLVALGDTGEAHGLGGGLGVLHRGDLVGLGDLGALVGVGLGRGVGRVALGGGRLDRGVRLGLRGL